MSRRATTFRIDPDIQAALANLSRILVRPMNQLVNEAVKVYVELRGREVEQSLEADLASLRAYRRRDPDFEQAIAAFAQAEVGVEDPVDGRPVEESGPVRAEIRRLLNG